MPGERTKAPWLESLVGRELETDAPATLGQAMDRASIAFNMAELQHAETVLVDVRDLRPILRAAHREMMRNHNQPENDTP